MKFRRPSKPSRKNSRRQKKQRSLRTNLHAPDALNRLSILRYERLEDRTLLSITQTFYVANPAAFTDTGNPGNQGNPHNGDTVTWNGGGQFTSPVAGLTYGTNAFGSIQAAVTAASSGDTIDVAPGTYSEQVIVGIGNLTLDGAQFGVNATGAGRGTNESVLDASGISGKTPLTINANDVIVNGFTVENQTNVNIYNTAIFIEPAHHGTHVVDNIVQNNMTGLFLVNDSNSDQAVVQDN
ncbi:MAG: hypothetical protein B7Z73_14495, partial [Planctomycetia bacterium 21-64-5]